MKLIQSIINLFSGSKKSDREIRNIFFNLVQNNQGSITVMDLAMAANLSGTDAKKALEKFAVEFDASFEVTEKGNILYLFPIRNKSVSEKISTQPQSDLSLPTQNDQTRSKKQVESRTTQAKMQNTVSEQEQNNTSNRKSWVNQEAKNTAKKDEKSNYSDITDDVQRKVEDIKKIESDLKKFGKSLNDLFK
ncbi:hypothetical protein Xen7305DRAFT_00013240 [Xenococcus sp. PCC 7305]|uniref:hypothetical protein n=1 Tax=Xenococcus sp. PCC 7305 TaxID=102125 RepID=UPI0002AC4AB7|nr:hypothetical protein [Xenococcus sp. PCC 7305]ELS01619.1 hypothetical protein Xen7305DRAFT_00013240 [Xenococcus sp. PCC 7305]